MELEIKLLRRKLAKAGVEGSEQQTVEDLMAEAKAELATNPQVAAAAAAEEEEEKKPEEAAALEEDAMNKELSEFEVKELDLLKYKHEQDVIALKKEYGEQLDVVTNRVNSYFYTFKYILFSIYMLILTTIVIIIIIFLAL